MLANTRHVLFAVPGYYKHLLNILWPSHALGWYLEVVQVEIVIDSPIARDIHL